MHEICSAKKGKFLKPESVKKKSSSEQLQTR